MGTKFSIGRPALQTGGLGPPTRGAPVGADIVGADEGALIGAMVGGTVVGEVVVGEVVGAADGASDELLGSAEGAADGVVGCAVGLAVGSELVGDAVGRAVVGDMVGVITSACSTATQCTPCRLGARPYVLGRPWLPRGSDVTVAAVPVCIGPPFRASNQNTANVTLSAASICTVTVLSNRWVW